MKRNFFEYLVVVKSKVSNKFSSKSRTKRYNEQKFCPKYYQRQQIMSWTKKILLTEVFDSGIQFGLTHNLTEHAQSDFLLYAIKKMKLALQNPFCL